VSLGRGQFAYEIGNLVKYRARLDFDKLIQAYEARSLAVKESEQTALLEILHKVGLALANGKLSITSAELWQEVSMLESAQQNATDHEFP
jgi:hypothetical protein